MSSWNFADLWEVCAEVRGDAPAAVHGDVTVSWAEFDQRADGLAAALLDAGLAHQDKVAQYLYNGPEYMQGVYGCFKDGMVPVNTNYRYGPEELVYLFDNADAEAIVFHAGFTEIVEQINEHVRAEKVARGETPRELSAQELEEIKRFGQAE